MIRLGTIAVILKRNEQLGVHGGVIRGGCTERGKLWCKQEFSLSEDAQQSVGSVCLKLERVISAEDVNLEVTSPLQGLGPGF